MNKSRDLFPIILNRSTLLEDLFLFPLGCFSFCLLFYLGDLVSYLKVISISPNLSKNGVDQVCGNLFYLVERFLLRTVDHYSL